MSDFLGYAGKRVIVSGCFSGMGEATAKMLIDLGAEVHGFDFKDVSLPLASFNKVDLRDKASIEAGVQAVKNHGGGGKVDALFNCAGLPGAGGFAPMDTMKVNFIGTRHLTEQVVPLMGEGSAIVSIASTGGLGWSRRIPVHMELLQTQGLGRGDRLVRRPHGPGQRGLRVLQGSGDRLDAVHGRAPDQAGHPHQLLAAQPDADADDGDLPRDQRQGDRRRRRRAARPLHHARRAGRVRWC